MNNFECHSSVYPVSELLGWKQDNRLELRPDFQRKEVWSQAAKIMLIDSILTGVPIPKILLKGELRGTQTYRIVIDGQQRISTILAFLSDGFPLNKPYNGPHIGLKYSELPEKIKDKILNYRIDINEVRNATDEEIREIYHRLNKYTFSLTAQEMRRADFPGDFLDFSEKLAQLEFFEDSKLFTRASSKRMADVEFVSELIVLLIDGPQDKKESLNDFYIQYSSWDPAHKEYIENTFMRIISDIKLIFDNSRLVLSKSRFRQKADFYAIFGAIFNIHQLNGSIAAPDELDNIGNDMRSLDLYIEPKSSIHYFSEYAIRCTSDANSASSRRWRIDFLMNFIRGSYFSKPPPLETAHTFFKILCDSNRYSILFNEEILCGKSESVIDWDKPENYSIVWKKTENTYHLSNCMLVDTSTICTSDGFKIAS